MTHHYNSQPGACLTKGHTDRKIIIHLGMPKTGSTWLQTCMLPKLRRVDVCHRESFRFSILGWSNRNILISYENYVGYPYVLESRNMHGWINTRNRALNNLSLLCPGADVILVVRNQTELVKSLYNQYIRIGGSLSFHDYVSGNSKYSLEKEALEYAPLIKQIRDNFSGRLLLINYRLFKDDKEKFGRIFLDFIGSDENIDFTGPSETMINESLTETQISYMNVFNKIVHNEYSPTGLKLPGRKTYKRLRKLVLWTAKLISGHKSHGIYNTEDMKVIEKYFSDDWKRLNIAMKGDCLVMEPRTAAGHQVLFEKTENEN